MSQFYEKNMKLIYKVKPSLFNDINKQLGGLYPN